MPMRRLRVHAMPLPNGGFVIERCGKGGFIVTEPCESDKPLPAGATMLHVEPHRDGRHHMLELVGVSGPPQVATDAYREGWDRIFGPFKEAN